MQISAIALQGLNDAQKRFEKTAAQMVATPDSIDLSQTAVDLINSRNSFATNVKLLRVGDEMQQSTLDLLA